MPVYVDAALTLLVGELRARYPTVEVVEARLISWPDGFLQQSIRYQAPLTELRQCGLVTEEMLRRRRTLSACGETSLGEAFHLGRCSGDAQAREFWDLDVCTESVPREPDEIRPVEAQRALERLLKVALAKDSSKGGASTEP